MSTQPPIVGVGLFVYHPPTQEFLLIEECKAKPALSKPRGAWSIPFETVHDGETIRAAMLRMIPEEIGRHMLRPLSLFQLIPDPCMIKYPTGLSAEVHLGWVEVPDRFVAHPEDPDVVHAGWGSHGYIRRRASLVGALRIEVLPALAHYLRNATVVAK